jgi:hypothetical protein
MSFTAHWQRRGAEVHKLLSSMPQRLAEIRQKKGGQPITILCIDICWITLFFLFNSFLIEHFVSEGLRFLSPGVHICILNNLASLHQSFMYTIVPVPIVLI